MDEAILEFKNMIKGLDEVYDRTPREHYTMMFLKAHANDLAKILQLLGQKNMLRDMMELDPDNLEIYKKSSRLKIAVFLNPANIMGKNYTPAVEFL